MARSGPFAFAQLEFGFQLGPADGRYVVRPRADAEAERVIVLSTVGAPPARGRLARRPRPRRIEHAAPAAVPVTRATIVRARPFATEREASAWLMELAGDAERLTAEVEDAVRELNRALRAHRAAAADPYARDVSAAQALAVRVGYGDGEQVAEGRFRDAYEVPRDERRRRRAELLLPDERLAAVLGGRDPVLACEELLLRARADLDAGRLREAALQARIALEALLAELGERGRPAERLRPAVREAANAALTRELDPALAASLRDAVAELEAVLRRAK
ncbi:MAG: hypothetical protein IRZ21_06720 [Thermoleophilaceae bacterium]|nr:hypothetical protein [Thermoleophilaceae bacterium]